MSTEIKVDGRFYSVDALESIIRNSLRDDNRAMQLVRDHKIDIKIGERYVDAIFRYFKERETVTTTPPCGEKQTDHVKYVRYHSDNRKVYLITQYVSGRPVVNHELVGHSTEVEFGPTPNGPWHNGRVIC